jgi:hypothetical protein
VIVDVLSVGQRCVGPTHRASAVTQLPRPETRGSARDKIGGRGLAGQRPLPPCPPIGCERRGGARSTGKRQCAIGTTLAGRRGDRNDGSGRARRRQQCPRRRAQNAATAGRATRRDKRCERALVPWLRASLCETVRLSPDVGPSTNDQVGVLHRHAVPASESPFADRKMGDWMGNLGTDLTRYAWTRTSACPRQDSNLRLHGLGRA